MTPWAPGSPGQPFLGWRIDLVSHAPTWDSGIGAEKFGGRWNSRGVKAVYCAVDPSTAILEVAVHKGFHVLDSVAHTLTAFSIPAASDLFIVNPEDVPNPAWLWPGTVSPSQQAFGDSVLSAHPFVLIPSAVLSHSWNLILNPILAIGKYSLFLQERLALDSRLNPAPTARP